MHGISNIKLNNQEKHGTRKPAMVLVAMETTVPINYSEHRITGNLYKNDSHVNISSQKSQKYT